MTVLSPTLPVITLNSSLCPLCGEANVCAVEIERESGIAQAPCWCMAAVFGDSLRDRVPVEARGRACICARCVAKATPTVAI